MMGCIFVLTQIPPSPCPLPRNVGEGWGEGVAVGQYYFEKMINATMPLDTLKNNPAFEGVKRTAETELLANSKPSQK